MRATYARPGEADQSLCQRCGAMTVYSGWPLDRSGAGADLEPA
jgi:hypothetical protein